MALRLFFALSLTAGLCEAEVRVSEEKIVPPIYETERLDNAIAEIIVEWDIPGCSIAVIHAGELIHWKTFGYADRDEKMPVTRDTLFRIASISKPVTAVAVLRMVEERRLSLDDVLADTLPRNILENADPAIPKVTVRQILEHSGGWDDGEHGEVALRNDVRRLARECAQSETVTPEALVRRRFTRPLDFPPGADHAYSNFGYVVLGRIIEKATGHSYPDAVAQIVWRSCCQDCSPIISNPWLVNLAKDEARYYDYAGALEVEAALEPGRATTWPDGGIPTTTLDSALGWAATAECVAKFVDDVFGPLHGRRGILSENITREILARPNLPKWAGNDTYYGLGWRVKMTDAGPFIWHSGSLPGTVALAVHTSSDYSMAILMNTRPKAWDVFNSQLLHIVEDALLNLSQ